MKTSFSASVFSLVDVDEPSQVVTVSSRGSGHSNRGRGSAGHGGQSGVARGDSQQAGVQQVISQSKAVPSPHPPSILWWVHFNHGVKGIPGLLRASGETRFPGASQHRIPRPAGPHHGLALS